jgi:hypothetical protein
MSPMLSSVVTDTEIQRTFRMLRRSLGNARIAIYDPESKKGEHYLVVSRQPYPSLGYQSIGGVKGAGYFAYDVRGNKQLGVPRVTCYEAKSVKGTCAWKLQALVVQNLELR